MTVLIDTDVLVDVALDREPFAEPAARLLDHLEQHPGTGYVAWHSLANLYYLVRPVKGKTDTKDMIADLCRFLRVAPTATKDVQCALSLPVSDFEDALQVAAAVACGANRLVTRNTKHYKLSPIPAIGPREALDLPYNRLERAAS
jgi:predicted nucleic acid-binding protein